MNYQYLHSVVNEVYRDLPVRREIPEQYRRQVERYTENTDAMKARLPEGYCYAPIQAEAKAPLLCLTRTERKHEARSLAFFSQCAAWVWEKTLLLEDFDSLLGTPFFSEEQIDRYAQDSACLRFGEDGQSQCAGEPLEIHPEAIRAILYGVLGRWRIGSGPVRIIVPRAEAGDYNGYVFRAVRTIYSYFTLGMRSKCGFASYLEPGSERALPAVGLIFTPEELADDSAIRLDGSTVSAYKALTGSFGRKLDAFLNHLAGLGDPGERRRFLEMVCQETEFNGDDSRIAELQASCYMDLGEGLGLLQSQGSVESLLPRWKSFAAGDDKFPALIAESVWKKIDGSLTVDSLRPVLSAYFNSTQRPGLGEALRYVEELVPVCHDRQELLDYLAEAVRGYVGYCEQNLKQPPVKIYLELQQERSALKRLLGEEEKNGLLERYSDLACGNLRTEAENRRLAVQWTNAAQYRRDCYRVAEESAGKVRQQLGSRELAQGIEQEQKEKTEAVINEKVRAELEKLNWQKTASLAEATQLQSRVNTLSQALTGAVETQEGEQLRESLQAAQASLEEQIRAFRSGPEALIAGFGQQSYHWCLERAQAQIRSFDENGRKLVLAELDARRPGSLDEYWQTFCAHTGAQGPVDLAVVREKADKISKAVIGDLIELAGLPEEPELKGSLEQAALSLSGQIAERRLLGVKDWQLRVSLEQETRELPARSLEQLLVLDPECRMETQTLKALTNLLADRRLLRGEHLLRLNRLLANNEVGWKFLLKRAATGRLGQLSEEQLQAYFKALREDLSARDRKFNDDGIRQVIRGWQENGTLDDKQAGFLLEQLDRPGKLAEQENRLEDLSRENEKLNRKLEKASSTGGRGGKGWMIATCVLSAVTVALLILSVTLMIRGGGKQDSLPEPSPTAQVELETPTPEPTPRPTPDQETKAEIEGMKHGEMNRAPRT